ncbi:DM13 domain-containing protein [Aliikangiella marina]|uniref:DM13 domain-containing protein n=1 Tax=Aliikangiella marina TaxID=1712262 RepID=A0A545TBX8_9GAMM|nr:DM13 domain-containing protein [Aliikangiella marina]TQV74696.1 DM13 domain-containing protein [Aliikangiella marina]
MAFKIFRTVATHTFAVILGFALGIYLLPILIAPESPTHQAVTTVAESAEYTAQFTRELKGSDALHWGEGTVFISERQISHKGRLSPGPDFKLYLSPEFVQSEAEFEQLKSQMIRVADIKTFEGFLVDIPDTVDLTQYNTLVIWCETFGEFITAAQYQEMLG